MDVKTKKKKDFCITKKDFCTFAIRMKRVKHLVSNLE